MIHSWSLEVEPTGNCVEADPSTSRKLNASLLFSLTSISSQPTSITCEKVSYKLVSVYANKNVLHKEYIIP